MVVWMRTPFFWIMMMHYTTVEESMHCSKTNSNFHTQASNKIIKHVIITMIRTPHTLHNYLLPKKQVLIQNNCQNKNSLVQYVVFRKNILKSSSTTAPPKCYSVAKRVTGSDLGLFSFRHIGIRHFVLYHSHGFSSACVQVRQ
jgi:hypothetical protein